MAGDRQDYQPCTARPGNELWGPSRLDLDIPDVEADIERFALAADCGCLICREYIRTAELPDVGYPGMGLEP